MIPERASKQANGTRPSRRDCLQWGSLAAMDVCAPRPSARLKSKATGAAPGRNCILLVLVGGPSQVDTFDPKPDAPAEVRGPYRPIRTNVPGIRISEILPKTARQADKFAIIRTVQHAAAPVHDAGHQLLQTGRLCDGIEHPHVGCVISAMREVESALPAHVILPRLIGHTGGDVHHGQSAGYLGPAHEPFVLHADPADVASEMPRAEAFNLDRERGPLRDAYGRNTFGQSCLLARRLIERGTRFVTVNMFETVFNAVTWDIHGAAPFCGLDCYHRSVGPMFDHAYSTLLADLGSRGLLQDTLVVAMGEFGRTPRINRDGGRDHWPHCWSILLAGGGIKGGQVVGESDDIGAYPKDRPVAPPEVVASMYHSMGVDLGTHIPGPGGSTLPLVDAGVRPIAELF